MQRMYTLQIKLLALFYPAKLFEQINQLTWYKETLYTWITEQNLIPDSSLLEVGCATGTLSQHLSKSYTITAVDSTKSMIKYAKSIHHKSIDFKVADVYSIPFPSGHFDTVIASSLLNIVTDKQKALLEMRRVCKHNGHVSILVPLKGFSDTDMTHLLHTLKLSDFSKAALNAWHTMAKKMSIVEIEALVYSCGLKIKAQKKYLEGMVIAIEVV